MDLADAGRRLLVAKPVGRRGETRERVLTVALDLFAEHGVAGASLQMIADRLGLTKAAVYHQFPSKEEIVLAVVQPALDQFDALLARAEAAADDAARRDAVLVGLVDMVLDQRRVVAALHGDPGVADVLRRHPDLAAKFERSFRLLHGPDPTPADLITGAMLGGGLMSIGRDPWLAELPDDVLREALLTAARRLLGAGSVARDAAPGEDVPMVLVLPEESAR